MTVRKKSGRLAKAIVNAVGPSNKELDSDAEEETRAKVVDEEDGDGDVAGNENDQVEDEFWKLDFEKKSVLRAKTAPDLTKTDQRYKGKKVTRKRLKEDQDEDEGGLTVDEREHGQAELGHLLEVDSDDLEEDEDEEDDACGDVSDEEASEEEEDNGQLAIKTFSDGSDRLEKERKKGKEIKKQLQVWDSLLEVRIQLHKILSKVNRLPQPGAYSQFKGKDPSLKRELKQSQASISNALDELLAVRESLVKSNVETKEEKNEEPLAKKRKVEVYSDHLQEQFNSLMPYRNECIEKWNDKTRLAGGSQKSFAAFELSTLKQIEHILSDKSRLVKRTQLKRSEYDIFGQEEGENRDYDPEVFDDDDFYHQLLRDLIEKRTDAGTSGDALSKKWLQIQKLRSKSKRKVDTRASKGRRIRYDIHSKLVNFMAPAMSHDGCQVSEEARSELFNSLFK